ncbi:DUF5333 domain-containing protein [Palleronia caenipelagi]|uniref:DUF5333 domain-containing protein n=1 Tax=Palleronia caenipelagi TaxID=2489174 RepID=A0A547Q546_9RHOB|nr:DUF5333 domain-containing protein [Palleronia caenipelagi]TRD21506.1 hypothetical protein FEV53_08470 [Palleronia caenipelagi]
MNVKVLLIACITLTSGVAGASAAQTPLDQHPRVRDSFYAIGLADQIRRNCPQIQPRLVRAYTFIKSLERWALNSGYTEADVDALTDNKAARSALEAEIARDLAARGATPGNAAGYCKVGREEIARGTRAGSFLKGN